MKTSLRSRAAIFSSLLFAGIANAGMMEDPWVGQLLFDKLETAHKTTNEVHWEIDSKLYQNLSGFVWKSEGERTHGDISSDNMFLYSQGFKPYWDWQIGIGHDTGEQDNTWGVIGIAGMAPYFLETETHLLVNGDGALLKVKAERNYLVTQRLMWVPEAEITMASTDMPKAGVSAGLSDVKLGLRLRYEFSRKLAPYAGIEWHQTRGNGTRSQRTSDTQVLVGVRFWL